MSRFARVVAPGFPHHLTHRGNRGSDVFFTEEDRERYLQWLREYCEAFGAEIWAYCLMSNHVHLIVVPRHADSLARAVGKTHMRYARSVNRQQGWSGHLWANRFYSAPLDTEHLWHAVRYVEQNPVQAGLCDRAEDYAWSSARAHALGHVDHLLSADSPFPDPMLVGDWSHWLAESLEQEAVRTIQRSTSTGRPCGSQSFVEGLERLLGRNLTRSKPGPKVRSRSKN